MTIQLKLRIEYLLIAFYFLLGKSHFNHLTSPKASNSIKLIHFYSARQTKSDIAVKYFMVQ